MERHHRRDPRLLQRPCQEGLRVGDTEGVDIRRGLVSALAVAGVGEGCGDVDDALVWVLRRNRRVM